MPCRSFYLACVDPPDNSLKELSRLALFCLPPI
jgi:hypothetical protein